jgi:hypothetical protein
VRVGGYTARRRLAVAVLEAGECVGGEIVQSYLSTTAKWDIGRYDALKRLFTTGAWIPHALTPDTAAA